MAFGQRVFELAAELGKTKQDVMRATNASQSTIDRLARGNGSMRFALSVKKVLKDWGADMSKVPPLDEDAMNGPIDEWMREWIAVGERLHELASEKRFQVEVDRVRDVIRAHELVAEGTDESSRRR